MLVNKIKNISDKAIAVGLKNGNSVILTPSDIMENIDVSNIEELQRLVQIEYNLSEVNPLREGKQYLRG